MNGGYPTDLPVILALSFASLVCALSSLGLLLMRGFYDKLHYLAPPAVLGLGAVTLAIFLEEGFSSATLKAVLVFAVTLISNPVITYAAARAYYLRTRPKS